MISIALPTLTLFLGITSIILLLIGYVYSVLFWIKFIYVKKILVPVVATVAFACGSFYLGPTVSFISLLLGKGNIPADLYYILSYVWIPIGTMGLVYMALTVFKPKMVKPAMIFYGIVAVIYWIFMFGFTDQQHTVEPVVEGELLDVSHAGVSLIVTGISLLSVLFIDSLGFFILARKLKKQDFPSKEVRKSFQIGLGWLLFFISGVWDAMIPPQKVWLILVVRGLMMVAFNLIYLGFWSKPVKVEQ